MWKVKNIFSYKRAETSSFTPHARDTQLSRLRGEFLSSNTIHFFVCSTELSISIRYTVRGPLTAYAIIQILFYLSLKLLSLYLKFSISLNWMEIRAQEIEYFPINVRSNGRYFYGYPCFYAAGVCGSINRSIRNPNKKKISLFAGGYWKLLRY